jgi:hypothetical protein
MASVTSSVLSITVDDSRFGVTSLLQRGISDAVMFIECFVLSLRKNVEKVAGVSVSESVVRGPMPVCRFKNYVI